MTPPKSLLLIALGAACAFEVNPGATTVLAQGAQRACNVDDPALTATEKYVVAGQAIFNYMNQNYNSEIYGLAETSDQVVGRLIDLPSVRISK